MINIIDKTSCCGCTACYSACPQDAISMCFDSEGFKYPAIDTNKCIECGLCEKVCPLIESDEQIKRKTEHAYCLYNNDPVKLISSSSGGIFSELSKYIIENAGVVYGAVYDNEWTVCHKRAAALSQLQEFRGSKYVQSDLRDTFKSVAADLKANKLVLFSGTPCQVAGLKKFLHKDYTNLITCDLLCHGVPSPLVFKDYISLIQKKRRNMITNINMKDKTEGWGKQSLRIYYENNTSEQGTSLSYLWNKVFFSNLALRPSCYACKFVDYNRCSDLTIGDYWNINKFHPEFYNKDGVSIILIQTDRGFDIFNAIKEHFTYHPLMHGEYPQESLEQPVEKPVLRDCYWKDLSQRGFTFAARKYFGYEDRAWKLFFRKIKMKFHR